MGNKPKDTIPHEEKRMQELNLFDPKTNIHRNVTGERLSEFFYSLSLSSPAAILFKSIDGMSIETSMSLCLTNITNEVVVNHKTPLVTKKSHCFYGNCVLQKRKRKTLRKVPGCSQITMLGKGITRGSCIKIPQALFQN